MEGILLGAFYLAQKRGQDLSKYTVPTSFAGISVLTTVVYFLPIKVVRMLNAILSAKYKNVRTLQ